MKKRFYYLGGFVVMVGVLLYLLSSTFRSALQYYVTVSELAANQDQFQSHILKVAGRAKNIQKSVEGETLRYDFAVEEGGQVLHVAYRGFVPDTFREGSEVVVTGSLAAGGVLEGTEILAKCASKYEAKLQPTDDSVVPHE